ncbi:hypothetical protein K505DRAFT_326250 [Melanomma pulvis-pyrius CBS 109.77]|uniref:Uncharacterized protein n=1 Tax=Melanomma pulvis-pyrius CBS 109.77 TaxID=1314802 RepID=A0A6A6X7N6_9PLEO|nr:hypothetical protein K505DRAFT_326250 [Melanomma pulvis-pyrius CBS 109.77]
MASSERVRNPLFPNARLVLLSALISKPSHYHTPASICTDRQTPTAAPTTLPMCRPPPRVLPSPRSHGAANQMHTFAARTRSRT